ncbi:SMC-Scp complex subunit ScpB [Candidatus Woesearchaeota archaeon]|nr:SMC-Scp complex subunit ScpB [Candidatus Woesearchaeota archaeon]
MNDEQFEELKHQIDSILFAAGSKVELTEIARLCSMGHNLALVEQAMQELQKKYENHPTLMLLQEGNAYKLQLREKYISVVKNLVTKIELTKTVMETLAVVAYKAPVLQSEIVHIRTNKAYDHLDELENAGYLTRTKKGRTKLIRLTDKFFAYFDIPPEKLKEKFQNIAELEKTVEEKEAEVHQRKEQFREDQERKKVDEHRHKEHIKQEHEKLSKVIAEKEKSMKLETYTSLEKVEKGEPFEGTNIEVVQDKLGELEIVEEESSEEEKKAEESPPKELEPEYAKEFSLLGEEKVEEEKGEGEEKSELGGGGGEESGEEEVTEGTEAKPEEKSTQESAFAGKGLFTENVPPGFEKRVDQRVKEIVHPEEKKEGEEEKEE